MPAPESLKVGDLVRFVALPDEWLRPRYTVQCGGHHFHEGNGQAKLAVSRKGDR